MNDNINMDTAWTWTQHKHGYSMDTAWKQHGHSMDTTWTQHGQNTDTAWTWTQHKHGHGHNIHMDSFFPLHQTLFYNSIQIFDSV